MFPGSKYIPFHICRAWWSRQSTYLVTFAERGGRGQSTYLVTFAEHGGRGQSKYLVTFAEHGGLVKVQTLSHLQSVEARR